MPVSPRPLWQRVRRTSDPDGAPAPATAPRGDDRRAWPRLPIGLPVRVAGDGAPIEGWTFDLSGRGTGFVVDAASAPPVGADVTLHLELPGTGPLAATARIVRVSARPGGGRPGPRSVTVGARLDDDQTAVCAIERFVRERLGVEAADPH
ncbi:PilZ domain-containing protein [Nitriliruptoraceae bacterium ZYF776]|nr:PilZ domain-containing protein [Profundirhabdus halotolerans]